MTDQQKAVAIIAAIQSDAQLIILMRAILTNNIPLLTSDKLELLRQVLQIPLI